MTETITLLEDGTIMHPGAGALLGEYGVQGFTKEKSTGHALLAAGRVALDATPPDADAYAADWALGPDNIDPLQVVRLHALAGVHARDDDAPRPSLSS